MVSSFKEFRSDVKTFLGFPWDTENVYFSQERDRYAASYKPKYPDNSGQDMVIQTIYGTDASKRGNYELIVRDGTKLLSLYFKSLKEIKNYFAEKEIREMTQMTMKEAIEGLESKREFSERILNNLHDYDRGEIKEAKQTVAMCESAISGLKELQQYRRIGTVEECQELASIVNKAEKDELAKIIDEWLSYSKIGTIEECRKAQEKQVAMTEVEMFYEWLQGGESPGNVKFADTPHLTADEAFSVIYYLQEVLKILPDKYERCKGCGEIYDSDMEGICIDEHTQKGELLEHFPKEMFGTYCDDCRPD